MVLKKLNHESEIALRHLEVLQTVGANQPIGIFKLAEVMGIPRHKIRYSLRVLEQSGMIEPTQYGAVLKEDHRKLVENMRKDLDEVVQRVDKMSQLISKL
ncbi:MAG: hypothetical protein ACLFVX_04825 [Archaeoglobaceae archaeon]